MAPRSSPAQTSGHSRTWNKSRKWDILATKMKIIWEWSVSVLFIVSSQGVSRITRGNWRKKMLVCCMFPLSLSHTQTPYSYSHLSLFSLYWSQLHLGSKRAALFTILNVCHKNTADPKLYDQPVIVAGRGRCPHYVAPEEDNNQARHFPPILSISRTWYVKHWAPSPT